MNYFLIANNDLITDKSIEDLPLREEDVVILYNRQMPLKWERIKNHNNKILFLRAHEKGYHGENLLHENKDIYKDIILISPLVSDEEISKYKDKYKLSKLSKYSYSKDISNLGIFDSSKVPQSGLISYIYIREYNKFDKIYLVGFTSSYVRIWKKHSKEIEQDFYKEELKKGFIIKIDS